MLRHDSNINFFLFYAANFFFLGAYYLLFPIIPGYAHSLNAGILGVIPVTVVYFFAAMIAAPIIGYIADWQGRLKFAITGAILSVACSFAYSLVHSIALLLLIRLVHGIATAAFTTAMLSILTDATENVLRAEVLSSYLIPQLIWTAIGPSFALFLFPIGGAKTIFITAAIFGLFGVIFTLFVKKPKLFSFSKQVVKPTELLALDSLLILVITFVFNAVYSALLLNVEIFVANIKGDALVGFYAWFVIAGLLVMYNAGSISDKIGRVNAVLLGLVFLAVSVGMLVFAGNKSIAAVAGILFGIAYGLLLPSLTVWWMDIIPAPKRGFYIGVAQAVQSAGMVIGLWILNLFGFLGPKGVFTAAFAAVIILLIAIVYMHWPSLRARLNGK